LATVGARCCRACSINAVRRPNSKKFTRGFLIVTPGLTIRHRLRVLQPNDPDAYYADRELVPQDMLPDLDRAKIDAAMTHRSRITTLDAELTLAEVTAKLQESPYSRIPLWREREDNIVGILHVRDLIGMPPATRLSEVMHRAWFVPDTTSLQKQLEAFSERHAHMAIVVDEYGDLQGLVTLEDILEEIVGDIHDERDRLGKPIARDTLGNATVPGDLSINEVNRLMEWDLPVESAATLAGLVVEAEQRIVEVGETVRIGAHRIEVLDQRRGVPTELRLHADAA